MIRIFLVAEPALAPDPQARPDIVVPSRTGLRDAAARSSAPDGRRLEKHLVDLLRALAERLSSDDADVIASPPAVFRVVAR